MRQGFELYESLLFVYEQLKIRHIYVIICYIIICGDVISVGKSWLRRRLRADQDVHNSDEFCEGLGCWVPSPGRDEHAVLDRDSSQRAAAVAWQSAVADGVAPWPNLFCIVAITLQLAEILVYDAAAFGQEVFAKECWLNYHIQYVTRCL